MSPAISRGAEPQVETPRPRPPAKPFKVLDMRISPDADYVKAKEPQPKWLERTVEPTKRNRRKIGFGAGGFSGGTGVKIKIPI